MLNGVERFEMLRDVAKSGEYPGILDSKNHRVEVVVVGDLKNQ